MNALEQHIVHVIAEAMQSATARYWLRRAQEFEAARPRPGDFHGQSTIEDRRRRWRELTEIANACRARAYVAQKYDDYEAEVLASWNELAA